MAGAKGNEIEAVAKRLKEEGKIRVDRAEEILRQLRNP
jgi:hydroxymethylglutaryl-CoA reductase